VLDAAIDGHLNDSQSQEMEFDESLSETNQDKKRYAASGSQSGKKKLRTIKGIAAKN
jgi:hypothetical protein